MKLSRSIINRMPNSTPREIGQFRKAEQKLERAESFVKRMEYDLAEYRKLEPWRLT